MVKKCCEGMTGNFCPTCGKARKLTPLEGLLEHVGKVFDSATKSRQEREVVKPGETHNEKEKAAYHRAIDNAAKWAERCEALAEVVREQGAVKDKEIV